MGQQPSSVIQSTTKNRKLIQGRTYIFNTSNNKVVIMEHIGGHPTIGISRSHFNVLGSKWHYFF